MNENNTVEKLRRLYLGAMARLYHQSLTDQHYTHYTADELLTLLVDAEWEHRQKTRIESLIRQACFKQIVSPQDIDYMTNRSLDRNVLDRLLNLQFLEKAENIIITGPTGCGKSFLAQCLGVKACQMLNRTHYYPATRFLDKVKLARLDGSYSKMIRTIGKLPLLIIDDFLLTPVDQTTRTALLDVIEERYEKGATIISTQIPVEQWHPLIGESTMADAILDRLVYSSHRITLTGESLRKNKKLTA